MFIYVARGDNGPAKIGFAREPKSRLSLIQTGCPYALKLVYIFPCEGRDHSQMEKYIHGELKPRRSRGEWFNVSDKEAIAVIERAGRMFRPKPPEIQEPPPVNYKFPLLTPAQARGARAILSLSLKDASEQIGIGINTLGKFEMEDRVMPTMGTAYKIAQFYQARGIEFPDELTIRHHIAQIEQAA